MIMLNGCHKHRSLKVLQTDESLERAAQLLRMCYEFLVDGKPISPAHAFTLSKFANISTEIVRQEAMFTDTIQSPLNYA